MIRTLLVLLFCLYSGLYRGSAANPIRVGAEQLELLLPRLQGKRVGIMVNQSSILLTGDKQTHLLDTLLSRGISIDKIFVPEHGFRGNVDAGKAVRNGRDTKTNLPIISLYGKHKRPTAEMLSNLDVLVFDLQDVGARFYTYISSMLYLMEVCAEQGKTLIICDRPNPNDYIDGPVLEVNCKSFIGVAPIPLVHGMTVGELARMFNEEGCLRGNQRCPLIVIPVEGWKHGQAYQLAVRPSPNLTTPVSIALYPSLCLFEATIMSVGRGTDKPFQIVGYPDPSYGNYQFTPQISPGADSKPKYRGQLCYGTDYTDSLLPERRLWLAPLIHYYNLAKSENQRLINQHQLFYLLAGTKELAKQLERGESEEQIRASWQPKLEEFRRRRKLYLLYPDYTE